MARRDRDSDAGFSAGEPRNSSSRRDEEDTGSRRSRRGRDSGSNDSGGSPVKLILLIVGLVIGIPTVIAVLVLCVIFGMTFFAVKKTVEAGNEMAKAADRNFQEVQDAQRKAQLDAAERQRKLQEDAIARAKKKEVPNLPPLAKIPGTNQIDLIALIDPPKDGGGRRWEFVNNQLHCKDGGGRPRLEIPCIPPTEYDFIVQFSQPKLRNGISLIMPNPNGGGFFWAIGYGGFGPQQEGSQYSFGANPANFEKSSPGLIKANVAYTTTVQVRRNSVRALLNGFELMNLQTDYKNLALKDWRGLTDARLLAIDCDDETVFHQVRLVEVTGVAKRIR